jgi:PA14 domain
VLLGPSRGLQAEYFAGDQLGGIPVISGVDDRIATEQLQARWYGASPDAFSAQWFGYLTVVRSGRYTFALTADDAAFLSVDGRRVIENGGRHSAVTVTGDVALTAGPHAVLIEFTQYGGAFALDWRWARGAASLARVPAWALSPYKAPFWQVLVARALDLSAMLLAGLALVVLTLSAWRGRSSLANHPRWMTLALFVTLAIGHTWPLATSPGHLTRHDNRDTMLNEWIVAWVAHQAPRDPLHLFDANIFYPERGTLAYSEAMLPQAAMAEPLFALGASPVLVYNLLLIAGFALSGWAMCLVVRRWTRDWTAGIVAGAVFAFNAHLLTRLPHLQAQHVEFLPLSLLALDGVLTQPSTRGAVRLALWSVLQATTSVYLLVFTFVALAAGVLARPRDWIGPRFWPFARALGTAALLAALALVPFLIPYYRANHDLGLTRSLSDAALYAATWKDYLSTPSRLMFAWWSHRFFVGTALFPGAVGLALALVALTGGVAFRDARARMCLVIGVAGVALSFGPKLPGYATLYTLLPVLRAVRATARFGYLATLAVAVLAGFGVVALRRLTPSRAWPALGVVLLAGATAESLVAPLGLTTFDAIPPIYSHLPRDPLVRVVEIPFFGPGSSQFHASYMLNSTAHWRPIVNGYSGFQPPSFYRHAEVLQGFPDAPSMAMLHELGVTHVFVHRTQVAKDAMAQIETREDLRLVEVFGSIALYRIAR